MPIWIFCWFLIRLLFSLLLCCMRCLWFLNTYPLSYTCLAKVFSHSGIDPLHSMMVPFTVQKLLIWLGHICLSLLFCILCFVYLCILCFLYLCFVYPLPEETHTNKYCKDPCQWAYCLCFLLEYYCVNP